MAETKNDVFFPLEKDEFCELSVLEQGEKVNLGGKERYPMSVEVRGRDVVHLVEKLKKFNIDITDTERWCTTLIVKSEPYKAKHILSFVNGHWD